MGRLFYTAPHAKAALDMGFMISFAGNLTFPKAQQIRDAALEVPLDRLLIETDCPSSLRCRIAESVTSRRS
jgi:Tat protein secretion system quality control protein TatD with DNase activity